MIAERYVLEREIGRGGMGSVWLARDTLLGRVVAMKRIGMVPGADSPDVQRVDREARLAASLNHPHVVAVFDLVEAEGEHWLVMEYIAGSTLAKVITREGSLSPDSAAGFLRQAASGLLAAHELGIVHRDVKPSNILVTEDLRVKLTDFGIARTLAEASLTQTGLVTGSPAYLAPEVASGQSATPASDVWSLGATLFHMLAGRPPYDVTENLIGTLYQLVHDEPPRLAHAGGLDPLLRGTMCRDAEARWTMAQVLDFLSHPPRAAAPQPAARPPATPPERTAPIATAPPPPPEPVMLPDHGRGPRRRPPVFLPLMALLAVAAVAVIGITAYRARQHEPGSESVTSSGPSTPVATTPPPSETSPIAAPTAEGMTGFIDSYLSTVTTDPVAAFGRLTPAYQAESNGLAGFQGWWSRVRTARASDYQADPTTLTIAYTAHYVMKTGKRQTERIRLQLSYENGTYLIAGAR